MGGLPVEWGTVGRDDDHLLKVPSKWKAIALAI